MLSEFHNQVEKKANFEALFCCLEDYRLASVQKDSKPGHVLLLRQ